MKIRADQLAIDIRIWVDHHDGQGYKRAHATLEQLRQHAPPGVTVRWTAERKGKRRAR